MSLPVVRTIFQNNNDLTYICIYNSSSTDGIQTQGSNDSSFLTESHWIENEVFTKFRRFKLKLSFSFLKPQTVKNEHLQGCTLYHGYTTKWFIMDVVHLPADIRKVLNILLNPALLIFIPFSFSSDWSCYLINHVLISWSI